MIDFNRYPKQWIISQKRLSNIINGKATQCFGMYIYTASNVPFVTVVGSDENPLGLLIGWVIAQGKLHTRDSNIHLSSNDSMEGFLASLGGRFVFLGIEPGGQRTLREDSSGGFPAVYSTKHQLVASTTTLISEICRVVPDDEVNAIFDFPTQRGFLPFGLTSCADIKRIMPNFTLYVDENYTERHWPTAPIYPRDHLNKKQIASLVAEAAQIVKQNMEAILEQGETVLYLSGGHDSRMVLAACREALRNLRTETIGTEKTLDAHIAKKLARAANIPHRVVPIVESPREQVSDWVRRSGYAMYDPVSELVATVSENAPKHHPVNGSGAELARASNWAKNESTDTVGINLETLLHRLRMPTHPRIVHAGQKWLDTLPPMDVAMILDTAKIEQIHGCWAGNATYGHPLPLPSLQPFSGQRLNEIALILPSEYKRAGQFYTDFVRLLWPELLDIPVNRAQGLDKLKFWQDEIKRLVPTNLKRLIKPLR